ncbi:MAG: pyridoxal 5'-phosphate synthase glutaminase subunit PdxT [Candidatus Nanopelagicales bacterium]
MNPTPVGADVLVGVLALQGDFREHEHALAACGAATRRVRTVEDLEGIDALVVPGGESTTMSNLALRWGLMEPLRALVRGGLPAYGSCAGMIMLADRIEGGRPDQETIGGLDVTVLRNAFGRQVDSFEADIAMPAFGAEPVHTVFIRAPWVEQAGPGVEVLGTVPTGPAAGRIIAVRQGRLLATSFHPELTGDARIHRYFLEMVREQA